jgi:hypothetical protein
MELKYYNQNSEYRNKYKKQVKSTEGLFIRKSVLQHKTTRKINAARPIKHATQPMMLIIMIHFRFMLG